MYRSNKLMLCMIAFAGIINICIWCMNLTPISVINLFAGIFSIAHFCFMIRLHRKRIKHITHKNQEIEVIVSSIWNIKISKKKWWHFRKTLYRTDSVTYYLHVHYGESIWVKYVPDLGVFNINIDYLFNEDINVKICDPNYIKQIEHHVNKLISQ